MNVVGARPDGRGGDGPAGRGGRRRGRGGVRRAARGPAAGGRRAGGRGAFGEATGDEVAVVFDGRPFELDGGGRVEVGFAPGGRNAADHAIADWGRAGPGPAARPRA